MAQVQALVLQHAIALIGCSAMVCFQQALPGAVKCSARHAQLPRQVSRVVTTERRQLPVRGLHRPAEWKRLMQHLHPRCAFAQQRWQHGSGQQRVQALPLQRHMTVLALRHLPRYHLAATVLHRRTMRPGHPRHRYVHDRQRAPRQLERSRVPPQSRQSPIPREANEAQARIRTHACQRTWNHCPCPWR